MLSKLRDIFCSGCFGWATGPDCGDFGPNHTPVERWALQNANTSSPEQIIAAAIIESFAKNPDHWIKEAGGNKKCPRRSTNREVTRTEYNKHLRWHLDGMKLTNNKKQLTFEYGSFWAAKDNDNTYPYVYTKSVCHVNDIELSEKLALKIIYEYEKLEAITLKLKEIADKAKAEMQKNEAAWNLVENLLGMTRNENGALVPITGDKKCLSS